MNTTSLASALDSLFGTISTCDSIFAKNGSTKGLISAANLASVLGAGKSIPLKLAPSGTNFNNVTEGAYQVGASDNVSGLPSNAACLVFCPVYGYGFWRFQVCISLTDNQIYFRGGYSSSYNAWQKLTSTAV